MGNAKKEQLIAREEDELRKREELLQSPRRRSLPEAIKYKSPLGRAGSLLYRSMQTLPHFDHGHQLIHGGNGNAAPSEGPKSARLSDKGKDDGGTHTAATPPAASSPEPPARVNTEERSRTETEILPKTEDSPSKLPAAGVSAPEASIAEKNVRQMLERMLSDSAIELNSPSSARRSGDSIEDALENDIREFGAAAEDVGKELGAKSIRVLERILDRKNGEIRALVRERDMYKAKAEWLEAHLKMLEETIPDLPKLQLPDEPDSSNQELVEPKTTPVIPKLALPQFSLNTGPTLASTEFVVSPKRKEDVNAQNATELQGKDKVAGDDNKNSGGTDEPANPNQEPPVVQDVKQHDVKEPVTAGTNVQTGPAVVPEDDAQVALPDSHDPLGRTNEEANQELAVNQDGLHPTDSVLEAERDECILFRMDNDIKVRVLVQHHKGREEKRDG